jgi:hypothetical protein
MPVDAGMENAGFMMGQPANAFQPQNHEAHINAHRSLFMTEVVKTNPQLQGGILSHVMQHLQFMANEAAQEQIPQEVQQQIQEMQQQGQAGEIPQEQMASMQSEIQMMQERYSAPVMAQLTQDLLASLDTGSEQDPLVAIRQQELQLRDKEIDQEAEQFGMKQDSRRNESLQDVAIAQQRINTTKQVADDKLGIADRRLDQQANLKLAEMRAKFGGIR